MTTFDKPGPANARMSDSEMIEMLRIALDTILWKRSTGKPSANERQLIRDIEAVAQTALTRLRMVDRDSNEDGVVFTARTNDGIMVQARKEIGG